jgi:hypothetical protein
MPNTKCDGGSLGGERQASARPDFWWSCVTSCPALPCIELSAARLRGSCRRHVDPVRPLLAPTVHVPNRESGLLSLVFACYLQPLPSIRLWVLVEDPTGGESVYSPLRSEGSPDINPVVPRSVSICRPAAGGVLTRVDTRTMPLLSFRFFYKLWLAIGAPEIDLSSRRQKSQNNDRQCGLVIRARRVY